MRASARDVRPCRSPHGERGLKSAVATGAGAIIGRSPHGERGLKYEPAHDHDQELRSLSSWRAWIEIMPIRTRFCRNRSLSSWRAWIEITPSFRKPVSTSRSPHGERGLKSSADLIIRESWKSLSSWRAWIEMYCHRLWFLPHWSLSSWRAWIEISRPTSGRKWTQCRSPHGERGLK